MPDAREQSLLEPLLDSWDRNNRILVNLLHAVPEAALEVRAMGGSPSVAEMFTHIHYGGSFLSLKTLPSSPKSFPGKNGSLSAIPPASRKC